MSSDVRQREKPRRKRRGWTCEGHRATIEPDGGPQFPNDRGLGVHPTGAVLLARAVYVRRATLSNFVFVSESAGDYEETPPASPPGSRIQRIREESLAIESKIVQFGIFTPIFLRDKQAIAWSPLATMRLPSRPGSARNVRNWKIRA